MTKSWYSLRVFTGKENVIKNLIEKRVEEEELSHLIGRVLIPVEKELVLNGSKSKVKQKKLYFGLLFIEARNSQETRDFLSLICGVSDSKLTPLKDREVGDSVLHMFELQKPEELVLSANTQVKILEGPFKDHVGPIVEVVENTRYKVGINLFGREVPVAVEIDQVERL
jgi:transcription antitermination factor NusG